MKPLEGPQLSRGTTVYRYIVLCTLGWGGMGVVYLAFDAELKRKVALKLLHTRTTDAGSTEAVEVRARLLREAQALAKLSHPNVLPVYDVGSYEDAVFMATEYVEGSTLREWTTSKPRTWREIVTVLLAAGRGLAAAHAVGLVHRDFKPHNVMIGTEGQIRVMDFGLVRTVLEPSDAPVPERSQRPGHDSSGVSFSQNANLTLTGAFVGTPAYMAPEQHRDSDVDTRADQFSFCVALYECLYGVRPFPSARDDMLDACRRSYLAAPTLDRRVPGWLRKLVLRGLSFRPEDRWPSMDALLNVLSRHASKRLHVAAIASAAILAFAAGSVAWAQQLAERSHMCSGGPAQIEPIWGDAQRLRTKAALLATGVNYAEDSWLRVEALVDAYVTEWLGMHREACEATHVRNEQPEFLMDLRMQCLKRRSWDVEGLIETLSRADAQIVERAVDVASGLPLLASCADAERLQAQVPLPDHPDVRTRVEGLWERLAEAQALGASGKTIEGLELMRSILDEAKSVGYGPLEAESWLQLARLQTDAQAPAAEEPATQAVLLAEINKMDELRVRATVLLVEIVSSIRSQPQEARQWGSHAQAIIDRMGGDPGLEAELLGSLALTSHFEGEYTQVRELGLRQLVLLEQIGRSDGRLGRALLYVGMASRKLGEYNQARIHLERAATVVEDSFGPRHPQLADILVELGRTLLLQGDYAQAHTTLQRAQTIVEASLGKEGGASLYAQTLLHHGRVFMHEGRHERAREYFEAALRHYQPIFPAEHPQIAYTRMFLGDTYRRQGDFDNAQTELEQAIENLAKASHKPLLASSLTCLGNTHLDRGDAQAALAPLERALSIMDSLGKNVRPKEWAETRFALGRALWASGQDPSRGHALVSQAKNVFATTGKGQARDLAAAERWLAQRGAQ